MHTRIMKEFGIGVLKRHDFFSLCISLTLKKKKERKKKKQEGENGITPILNLNHLMLWYPNPNR